MDMPEHEFQKYRKSIVREEQRERQASKLHEKPSHPENDTALDFDFGVNHYDLGTHKKSGILAGSLHDEQQPAEIDAHSINPMFTGHNFSNDDFKFPTNNDNGKLMRDDYNPIPDRSPIETPTGSENNGQSQFTNYNNQRNNPNYNNSNGNGPQFNQNGIPMIKKRKKRKGVMNMVKSCMIHMEMSFMNINILMFQIQIMTQIIPKLIITETITTTIIIITIPMPIIITTMIHEDLNIKTTIKTITMGITITTIHEDPNTKTTTNMTTIISQDKDQMITTITIVHHQWFQMPSNKDMMNTITINVKTNMTVIHQKHPMQSNDK